MRSILALTLALAAALVPMHETGAAPYPTQTVRITTSPLMLVAHPSLAPGR